MRRLLQSLEESEIAIVPTDKTNSFISIIKRDIKYYSIITPQKIIKKDIKSKDSRNI